jgi:hypothetical protein
MKRRVLVSHSQNPQSEIRNPQFLGLICAMLFALCSLASRGAAGRTELFDETGDQHIFGF